ncbi:4-(cytidine 5'-diphospho)-2-C-methyl-D-erythritol kinase [Proteiniphilum sp. UBA1028]|jgi:4-diphosphocytidyl-2-C-methyl-D-erythritol kinase|uniref:4-(cytidine 5'-diphospho)-2-C-methyl-D-erythritol kinase n=1 Tax=Proteiniphilum sp. UBA1028 TaxID=1947251 RepID=UPI000E9F782E|nr:4-(cytidine 5'-diphospho)-2-C-methyl-D-erythritol kinase [Proteiniphilum sp. UBA1028]HBG58617.1 4-(cytidine 5'-diphospho)-2-C-methyl-D-erythritol kinase [Porphyromonadaceae bacterium]
MICFPNAKINLGLHVVSRRPDGYHNLETIFYPLGMRDALEITPAHNMAQEDTLSSAKYRFFQTGIPIEGKAEDNLVIRALQLISAEKQIPPIDIHLLKKIPAGAGLGGGSSNAAFMLRLLNNTFALGYSRRDLLHLAAQLGADCPFFIGNTPSFATGTGDILEPVDVSLENYFMLLVKPDIAVSTKEAYATVTPRQPEVSLKEIIKKPVSEWKTWMKNDFELPVFKKYPEICTIKQQMYNLGAAYASMSGSGSAVYGIFAQEPAWQSMFRRYSVWTSSL